MSTFTTSINEITLFILIFLSKTQMYDYLEVREMGSLFIGAIYIANVYIYGTILVLSLSLQGTEQRDVILSFKW